jgi:hypothetical protein
VPGEVTVAKKDDRRKTECGPGPERAVDRPAYEPPRIEKKRSVSRATLFTGSGPMAGGLVAAG